MAQDGRVMKASVHAVRSAYRQFVKEGVSPRNSAIRALNALPQAENVKRMFSKSSGAEVLIANTGNMDDETVIVRYNRLTKQVTITNGCYYSLLASNRYHF